MIKRTATALAVVFFALAAAAAAHTVNINSAVSIKSNELKFSGRVTSSNAACADGRRVTLYRRLSNGGGQSVGHFTTGASGKWHVTVSGFAGVSMSTFYAKVKQRSEGTAGTTYVCRSAHSATIAPH